MPSQPSASPEVACHSDAFFILHCRPNSSPVRFAVACLPRFLLFSLCSSVVALAAFYLSSLRDALACLASYYLPRARVTPNSFPLRIGVACVASYSFPCCSLLAALFFCLHPPLVLRCFFRTHGRLAAGGPAIRAQTNSTCHSHSCSAWLGRRGRRRTETRSQRRQYLQVSIQFHLNRVRVETPLGSRRGDLTWETQSGSQDRVPNPSSDSKFTLQVQTRSSDSNEMQIQIEIQTILF